MKIISFTAENLKKLKVVQITPSGNVIRITGPNGSGKTSVLDAIYWALAGTSNISSKPVRDGEMRAVVKLDLGEFVVTRRFNESGGTSLTVEADGAQFRSPQKMLDELLGSLTFDPLAFSLMAPRQQLDTLKKTVTLDVNIDALDDLNAMDYAARTEINRTVKGLTEKANDLLARTNPNVPKEPIDPDSLIGELEGVAKFNAEIERERSSREADVRMNERHLEAAATKREQAAMLVREAEEIEQVVANNRKVAATLPPLEEPRDTATIRARIDEARKINAVIAINNDYATARAAENAARRAAQDLTDAMERRSREKAEAIARAKMPVDGLSFGEGIVLYNDLPFDQASSAEQLRISVAIAMAANPKLRVLRIQDGSLLDENSLRMIAEMAEANDMQVWVESVDTSGKVGIFMQEGEVAAIDGVPVGESQLTRAMA